MSTARFTRDGSEALEAHLARTCEQVRDGVTALVPPAKLDGLLLGGGYGRGEGGVLREPKGDQPYNDLEFYVLVRGWAPLVERKFRHPLHELGERLSPAAGLEVEFKVLTVGKLRHSGPSMFYYDLVLGHRWLVGEESLLEGCAHHREAGRIPLPEATRLLMNRCSGLLFAAERLQRPEFSAADADFVGRNLAKAQLAFGDVLLTAHGQYHWSCQERHARLTKLATTAAEADVPVADLLRHHAAGVEFKLHPVRSHAARETLAHQHADLVALGTRLWLWLEGRRLGKDAVHNPLHYANTPRNLCPETSGLRNRLVNARAFGWGTAISAEGARYPRERLFRALAVLLFQPGTLADTRTLTAVQHGLRTDAADLPGLVAAYQRIWSRFN